MNQVKSMGQGKRGGSKYVNSKKRERERERERKRGGGGVGQSEMRGT